MTARRLVIGMVVASLSLVSACAVVPQNRRKHLADPMMSFETDALDAHRRQKLYSTREAAAGGDGVPAGGGCGCQ
jgi:starvation-inducible outer membrane lipoprotein